MPDKKVKIAVIGAGPAGLAAAYRLAQGGCDVDVYEASDSVGGMCRTLNLWGYKVDLGPHRFFSTNKTVNLLWHQLVGKDFLWVSRRTRIFYQGKYFAYPLRLLSTFTGLGLKESILCIISYFHGRYFFTSHDKHFAEWIQHRFGERLYKIFFKTYSEKLWGLPCEEIDADFAYRKIRKLTLSDIIKSLLPHKKTYVEYFAYPHYGSVYPYRKLADKVVHYGGKIFFNTPIEKVERNQQGLVLTTKDQSLNYDHVVSSMPLPLLIKNIGAPTDVIDAAKDLKFRSTILVYLLIKGKKHFTDQWLYVHSDNVQFGRVTNFRNWSPKLYKDQNDTVLCLEYWCQAGDELWKKNEGELIELAHNDLKKTKLIKNLFVLEGYVHRIGNCYPVLRIGYQQNLQKIFNFLKGVKGLHVVGRYGAFKYNNQDHSVLMGLKTAEAILSKDRDDSQLVNTEHVYEENFEISEI